MNLDDPIWTVLALAVVAITVTVSLTPWARVRWRLANRAPAGKFDTIPVPAPPGTHWEFHPSWLVNYDLAPHEKLLELRLVDDAFTAKNGPLRLSLFGVIYGPREVNRASIRLVRQYHAEHEAAREMGRFLGDRS